MWFRGYMHMLPCNLSSYQFIGKKIAIMVKFLKCELTCKYGPRVPPYGSWARSIFGLWVKKCPSGLTEWSVLNPGICYYCYQLVSWWNFPKIKIKYGNLSLPLQGPKVWNEDNTSTKTKSKSIFKSQFKSYL